MSDATTKLAVLTEKVDNLESNLLHKLRNQENQIKMLYEEVVDINNKLKYLAIIASVLFFLVQGGLVDFVKTLM